MRGAGHFHALAHSVAPTTAMHGSPRPPVGNGLPGTCVSAPVFLSIAYTETSPELEFATKRNLPLGSVPTAVGRRPAANGLPGTRVSAPVRASIVYASMLAEP